MPIFDAEDWFAFNSVAARFGSLPLHGRDLEAIIDGFYRIDADFKGYEYRCHICGIPWGH